MLNDYTASVCELGGVSGDDDVFKACKAWLPSAVRRHLGGEGAPENGLARIHRISSAALIPSPFFLFVAMRRCLFDVFVSSSMVRQDCAM